MRSLRCLVVFAGLSLIGCNTVDLSAVQQFAKSTADAKQSFDDLAGDWLGTCIRRTEYARATPDQLQLGPGNPTMLDGTDVAGSPCSDAAKSAQQWQLRNDIVVNYVRALGAIAGVGSTPKNTDALAAGLVDDKLLPSGDKSAFSDIVSKITSLFIAGEQQAQIGHFARDNDKSLRTAIASLEFAADRYDEQLKNETSSLDQMYRLSLAAQTVGGTRATPEPIPFQAKRLSFDSERSDWRARRDAILVAHGKTAAYRDALNAIAKSHAEIVAHADHFGPGDLAKVLNSINTQLGDDLRTLLSNGKK